MAERSVTVVEDSKDDLPIIDNVSFLRTHSESGEVDPFSKNAADLKKGLSPGAKRRVTNKINKRQEGIGGASTKQPEDKEFLSGYDAFEVVQPKHNLDYLAQLYEASPHHYAAVNAKVSNIVGLGYKFVETRKTKRKLEDLANSEAKVKKLRRTLDEHRDELLELMEKFNKEDGFTETLVKMWRDYETTGNGYLEVVRKKDGQIGYIGHIPSKSLRIRKARDGFVQTSGFKTVFFANYGAGFDDDGNRIRIQNPLGSSEPSEIIHIRKYSPTSTYYGVPDIIAAKQAVAGNVFAERFNLDYFENKAIPKYVVVLTGAKLGPNAERNLLEFFETKLKGQNHRSLFIPLPASSKENPVKLEFEAIEAGVQDSSFINYRRANLSDILMAHRVPETKISVSENASLAVAKDADKTFKEQVCGPEQKMLQNKLKGVIRELTDAFELVLNEMTLTDEAEQSIIDERAVKNGWRLANEIRTRDGDPEIEGGNERVDPNLAAKEKMANDQATRERDSQRSAGRTDSAGAARKPKGEGRTTP